MIQQIDHIGVAVEDLEEALKLYTEILGLTPGERETLMEQKVTLAKVKVGEVTIELLQATDPDSPVGKFIAKRGGGVHHIAYRVGDIDAALKDLKGKGVKLIDEKARVGAGGTRIAFIHPGETKGVLTELVEKPA